MIPKSTDTLRCAYVRNVSLTLALIYDNVFCCCGCSHWDWHHHLSASVSVPSYCPSPNAHYAATSLEDGISPHTNCNCSLMVLLVDLLYMHTIQMMVNKWIIYEDTNYKPSEMRDKNKNTWLQSYNSCLVMPIHRNPASPPSSPCKNRKLTMKQIVWMNFYRWWMSVGVVSCRINIHLVIILIVIRIIFGERLVSSTNAFPYWGNTRKIRHTNWNDCKCPIWCVLFVMRNWYGHFFFFFYFAACQLSFVLLVLCLMCTF